MGVSKNSGTPKSSILNRVFHYKPSILGFLPLFLVQHPYRPLYKYTYTLWSGDSWLAMTQDLRHGQGTFGEPGYVRKGRREGCWESYAVNFFFKVGKWCCFCWTVFFLGRLILPKPPKFAWLWSIYNTLINCMNVFLPLDPNHQNSHDFCTRIQKLLGHHDIVGNEKNWTWYRNLEVWKQHKEKRT